MLFIDSFCGKQCLENENKKWQWRTRLSDVKQLLITRSVITPVLFLREQVLAFSSKVVVQIQRDTVVLKSKHLRFEDLQIR